MKTPSHPFERHPAIAGGAVFAPWYRHRWPWFLIAGPAIVVVAGFVTLWLSIASFDGLVADDYYRQGLGINKTIERAERASELALVAHVRIDADGSVGMRIEGEGAASTPERVRLSLLRPAPAGGDVVATLVRDQGDRYSGRMVAPGAGRAQIVIESDEWRLPSIEVEVPFTAIEVRADPRAERQSSTLRVPGASAGGATTEPPLRR